MADETFPRNGEAGNQANLRSWMVSGGVGDFILSGFVLSTTGSLGYSVSAGEAMAQGVRLKTTAAITGNATDAATNHFFLTLDENAADDVILTVNTTGTAPSTPYLKLGTAVASGGAITSISKTARRVQSNVQSLYDRIAKSLPSARVYEKAILLSAATGTAQAGLTRVTFSTSPSAPTSMNLGGSEGGAGAALIATATGSIIEACAAFNYDASNAWTALNGTLMQFGLMLHNGTVENSSGNTTNKRVFVCLNTSGEFRIITCSGSAVTNTATGFTVVAGRTTSVEIVFTVGTNVVVRISDGVQADTETTVTATLPDRISGLALGASQLSSGSTSGSLYPGAIRVTTT